MTSENTPNGHREEDTAYNPSAPGTTQQPSSATNPPFTSFLHQSQARPPSQPQQHQTLPSAPPPQLASEPEHRLPPAPYHTSASKSQAKTFVSHTGHHGISVWLGPSATICPPSSFQVYVTYEMGDRSPEAIRDLAESLWRECTPSHVQQHQPLRLDIILLGHVQWTSRVATCVQHYRQTAINFAARTPVAHPYLDPPTGLVPTCRRGGVVYTGFLIVVPTPRWRQSLGLGLLFFDPEPAPGAAGNASAVRQRNLDWVYPTRLPTAGGENLWDRELSAVWRSMDVVESWTRQYYHQLEGVRLNFAEWGRFFEPDKE